MAGVIDAGPHGSPMSRISPRCCLRPSSGSRPSQVLPSDLGSERLAVISRLGWRRLWQLAVSASIPLSIRPGCCARRLVVEGIGLRFTMRCAEPESSSGNGAPCDRSSHPHCPQRVPLCRCRSSALWLERHGGGQPKRIESPARNRLKMAKSRCRRSIGICSITAATTVVGLHHCIPRLRAQPKPAEAIGHLGRCRSPCQ